MSAPARRAGAAAAATLAALGWGVRCASARLVGASVIPHGDFAYDPAVANFTPGCAELHNASVRAGRFVEEELAPDVIFLTSPHGLELSRDFLIYENSHLDGAAPVGDFPHSSSYTVPMRMSTDTSLAKELRAELVGRGFNVTGLEGFLDSQPLPISWGEILPLTYVNKSAEAHGRRLPQVVVMSVPYRRFNDSVEMIPEMLRLGAAIAEVLERPGDSSGGSARRVAWVVSADLAHTHLASGPYGYCPCAQPFDDSVARWLRTLDSSALLADAALEQRLGAAACGFTGLVLLQGALGAAGGNGAWSSELLAIAAPTYYGMAVGNLRRSAASDEPISV